MLRPAFLLTTGLLALATTVSLGGSAAMAQPLPPYQQPPYQVQPYPQQGYPQAGAPQPEFDDLDDEDLKPLPGPGIAGADPRQPYPPQAYPQPGYNSRPPGGFIYPDDRQQAAREPGLRPPGDVG